MSFFYSTPSNLNLYNMVTNAKVANSFYISKNISPFFFVTVSLWYQMEISMPYAR